MESKVDILKLKDTIISEVYNPENRNFYTISELIGPELNSYQSFNNLALDKFGENDQLFISNTPIKRMAKIYDVKIDGKGFEEILYDDLSTLEKNIFDSFYSIFS